MSTREDLIHSHVQLMSAIQDESHKFQEFYLWLEKYMPRSFFKELNRDQIMITAHTLMGFHLQECFANVNLKNLAIVMTLDSPDADLKIFKNFTMYGIKNYRAFVSKEPFPMEGNDAYLRIAVVNFTIREDKTPNEDAFPAEQMEKLRSLAKERNPKLQHEELDKVISDMDTRFLRSLSLDRLILAIDMFFRAKTRDNCQYEVRYNEDWEEKDLPSMQIVLAWRNTPKYNFLYRLARLVYRHNLIMQKVNTSYIEPYSKDGILIMSLGLHGSDGQAVWDVADIPDFVKELVTMKYFDDFDRIDKQLVTPGVIRGNMGNLLRSMTNFIHQSLVHVDQHLYTFENVEEALLRHPELTVKMLEAFEYKFHPEKQDMTKYRKIRDDFWNLVEKLDTGREINDTRRRNVLKQAMYMVVYTLKTNFFRNNKTGFSFRLDPKYLDKIPFDRSEKFPDLPYAIFYSYGLHFFGFQIRFKDLARGGVRTIFPEKMEHMVAERDNIFTECYNLAYTQQKKNKDIPEGGAKGIIFLKPYERLHSEKKILQKELRHSGCNEEEIQEKIDSFLKEQKTEFLYQAQRSFVNSLLTIINCDENNKLRSKHVIDYWKRPEYIYLGPDENMHNSMIQWIAAQSKFYQYKPGSAFITSKPKVGINHKEWGVTSLGVNVYMHEVLKYLGIDPNKDPFTVKISGGPDGDVAGNQIKNLHRFYRKTAKLVALTDVSGTIYDPEGLDLDDMLTLFEEAKPIKFYPANKLSDGGFLLDRFTKRDMRAYVQQTLCLRKENGLVKEDWLSGSEMNLLFRTNVHKAKADIFIPAGGRPKTLSQTTYKDYLDDDGKPSTRAIVEGANLYITPWAREKLQELGVIIVKDSSANKGGVIASSFEVLSGLVLTDEELIENKEVVVNEILDILKSYALHEAQLLLSTHKKSGEFITRISDKVSDKINTYTYDLLDHLENVPLPTDPNNPLNLCYLAYSPPFLQKNYQKQLLENVPDHHKKAIIACRVAAQLVYKHGLDWSPSIMDILPLILEDPDIAPPS